MLYIIISTFLYSIDSRTYRTEKQRNRHIFASFTALKFYIVFRPQLSPVQMRTYGRNPKSPFFVFQTLIHTWNDLVQFFSTFVHISQTTDHHIQTFFFRQIIHFFNIIIFQIVVAINKCNIFSCRFFYSKISCSSYALIILF